MFHIIIVADPTFRESYWGGTRRPRNAVLEALKEFQRQFPGTSFEISRAQAWDLKIPPIKNFPEPWLLDLRQGMSIESVLDFLGGRLQENGIESGFDDPDEKKRVAKYLRGKSMRLRYAYLTGYLDNRILIHLLLDKLCATFPPKDSRHIIMGFTGVPQQTHSMYGHCLGSAKLNGNHSAFPLAIYPKLRNTVLHELGHVFGAEHPDSNTPSVMDPTYNDQGTLVFDNANRERIIAGMARRG